MNKTNLKSFFFFFVNTVAKKTIRKNKFLYKATTLLFYYCDVQVLQLWSSWRWWFNPGANFEVVLCCLLWEAQTKTILNARYTAVQRGGNWTLIYWSTPPQQAGIVIISSVYFKNVMSCIKPCGAKVLGLQSNSTLTRQSIKFKSLCGFNSVCITHFAIYLRIRHIVSLQHVTTVPKGWIEGLQAPIIMY